MFSGMFDELKKVKYFKEIIDFQSIAVTSYNKKCFIEMKRLNSLGKPKAYLKPK